MHFIRVLRLAVLVILILTTVKPLRVFAVSDSSCATKFQGVAKEPKQIASDLDRLIAFETDLQTAYAAIGSQLKTLNLSSKDAFRTANEKHLEILAIRTHYETLADDLLSENIGRIGDFERRFQEIQEQLLKAKEVKAAQPNIAPDRFSDLIDAPSRLKAEIQYEVPQAASVAGASSTKKLSVSFSREILDYFNADIERGSRFLRAIQKGYIGTAAGSGIVRITDHHEALVEIKVIGGKEGHQRLIGCRKNEGFIQILKVYEKRNEGAGGSLKHFAALCS